MAGIVVNVYLTDLFDCTKVQKTPDEILARLRSHYTDAFDFANKGKKKDEDKHKFNISWATAKPSPSDTDFVIHFLPWDFWSLARYMSTQTKSAIVLAEEWGLTTMRRSDNPPTVCSEVYVKNMVANDLADLAFHEMLHGKLNQGNEMHKMGGLGAASVGNGVVMNDANRKAVAETITRPRRMWPDAWGLAEGAAAQKKAGDPLWNI